jgi:hypothetical protein
MHARLTGAILITVQSVQYAPSTSKDQLLVGNLWSTSDDRKAGK